MNKKELNITVLTPEFYNYGAMLVAGILKEASYNLRIQKGFKQPIHADIVFLSLHSTMHLLKYKKTIENIDAVKIVGGPVSRVPELVFQNLDVDVVMVGEAEGNLLKLMTALENGFRVEDLHDVNGLAFKDDGTLQKTPDGERVSMVRPLPFIPEDISSENIRGANVYIETHRGCPGSCTFCQVPCFFGREVRSRPHEDVIQEVKAFLKAGARRIAVSGGTGTLYGSNKFRNLDENAFTNLLMDISSLTGPNNLTIPDIRVDLISPDILDALRRYTNGWVYFGIESGSPRILRNMKKGIKVEDVHEAVAMARNSGLKIAGSFIVGYPGEEEEDFQATVDLADELMLDDYFVSIAEPIPGTVLAEEVKKLPDEDNTLFQEAEEYKRQGLSLAEERALKLMMDSFVFRSMPVPMTENLFKALLDEVKSQGTHIKTVTPLIKGLKGL
jgi:B12-binding domain/radical SAM domain protein